MDKMKKNVTHKQLKEIHYERRQIEQVIHELQQQHKAVHSTKVHIIKTITLQEKQLEAKIANLTDQVKRLKEKKRELENA